MKKIVLIVLLNCLVSCAQKTNGVLSTNQCKLVENEIDIKNLSSNENDVVNDELKNYNNTNFKMDVLYYNVSEGNNYGNLERWYINDKNICSYVFISNNIRKVTQIIYNEEDVNKILMNVENKSFVQICSNCYDCKSITLLVKKNNVLFKLSSNNQSILSQQDIDDRINKYIRILKYFREKK